jgi:hypothetical protein
LTQSDGEGQLPLSQAEIKSQVESNAACRPQPNYEVLR